MKLYASFHSDTHERTYSASFQLARAAAAKGPIWSRFQSPRGPADEIAGAHVFARPLGATAGSSLEGVLEVALVVNNGTLEPDLRFRGALLVEDFELRVDPPFAMVPIAPRFGESWTGERAKLFSPSILPTCSSFTRRFLVFDRTVWPDDNASARDALVDLWLAGGLHPALSPRRAHPKASLVRDRILALVSSLTRRSPELAYDGALPDGRPNFVTQDGILLGSGNRINAGEQGGSGIAPCPDWAGTAEGGVLTALRGDLNQERCHLARFLAHGSPATRAELGTNWMHDLYRGEFSTPPVFVAHGAEPRGRISAALAHDKAHFIRFGDDVAAVGLIRDGASRLRLGIWAEDLRLGWGEVELHSGSDYVFPSLYASGAAAEARPNKGGGIPRAEGDAMWIAAAAIESLEETLGLPGSHQGSDEIRLASWRDWRAMAIRYAGLAMTPAGFTQLVYKDSGLDQNEEWVPPLDVSGRPLWTPFADNEQGIPAWQLPRWIGGMFALGEGATLGASAGSSARMLTKRAVSAAYVDPRELAPDEDGHGFLGNHRYLRVGRNGEPLSVVDYGVGPSRPWYDRHALALGVLVSADPAYTAAALRFGPPAANVRDLVSILAASEPEQNATAWRAFRRLA